MMLRVLFFGVLKDRFGAEHDDVELAEPASVADLISVLRPDTSNLSPVWSSLAVAVNRVYATRDTPLRDGDEVALLPPVSGG
jgi:molybdopterin converting factor subunit 1